MNDALNRRQSHAPAFKCIRRVQALKHAKQFIYVLHIKAHSIVPDEYYQVIFVTVGASDLDLGVRPRASEFYRVGNEIHQYKPQHRTISIEIWQHADFPDDVASLC